METLWSESADHDQLRLEVENLRASLVAESDRCSQLGAEVARLHASLHEASLACGSVHQMRVERDAYKQQLDDQLKFKRGPLEARLTEANRVLFEQRLQLRSIVDVLAIQKDWVREWAVQYQENMRLRTMLEQREAGVEVNELRKTLLDTQAKYAELAMSSRQREAIVAVHESKARSLVLDNQRLVEENALHKEQIKRLWRRMEVMQASAGMKRQRVSEGGGIGDVETQSSQQTKLSDVGVVGDSVG
jgi:hypothetical protein